MKEIVLFKIGSIYKEKLFATTCLTRSFQIHSFSTP